MVETTPSPVRLVMYLDLAGGGTEYRWRLSSGTGKTLARSIAGYLDKASCEKEIESLKKPYPAATVRDLTL